MPSDSKISTIFAGESKFNRQLQLAALRPDPMTGLAVEGFRLPDNLMIPGAVLNGGGHAMVLPEDGRDRAFDALDVFERCVALGIGDRHGFCQSSRHPGQV